MSCNTKRYLLNQKKKKSKSSWKLSIRVRVVPNFRKVVIVGSFSSSIQTFENEIIDFFNDWVLRSLEISCSVANSMSILIAKFEMVSSTRVPVLYARGAHFERNFIRFGWVMDISNNFSWGFQKCKFYQHRTHPVDAKLLPTQPT